MLQGAGKNHHYELYLLHRYSQMYHTKSSIKLFDCRMALGCFFNASSSLCVKTVRLGFFLMPVQVCNCVKAVRLCFKCHFKLVSVKTVRLL